MIRRLLGSISWRGVWSPSLDLYVLRRFVVLYLGNLASFTLVYIVIDLFENLTDFDERTDGVAELLVLAGKYYAATVPVVFCQLLGPVVCLTAGLFTVTLLHRANELVPMLANGRPFWRIVSPILAAALVICVGTFAVQELWIPASADWMKSVEGVAEGRDILRDKIYHDYEQGVLFRIEEYDVADRRASGVIVISIPEHVRRAPGEHDFYISAKSMEWIEPELERRGHWLLRDGHVQEYDRERRGGSHLVPPPFDGPASISRPLFDYFLERRQPTALIPEDIESQKEDVIYMDLADLRRKMRGDVLDRRWAVKYYARFATPMSALVLLLVGFPVIARYGSRNIFFGALIAACVACAYIVIGSVFTNLALRGFLPTGLGSWLAPILFASIGITWLRSLKA